jgi:hypothetical protein
MDIWTGREDHALRRIAVDVRFEVLPHAGAEGSAAQTGQVRLDLAFAALNQAQAIGAPARARPVSEPTAEMRRVLGANRRYRQCLRDADAEPAEVQACADLVGQ